MLQPEGVQGGVGVSGVTTRRVAFAACAPAEPCGDVAEGERPMGQTEADLLGARLYAWTDLRGDLQRPPRAPGVYAWFFRATPPGVPFEGCVTRHGLTLLYVGISPGRSVSTQTLRNRIRYHF